MYSHDFRATGFAFRLYSGRGALAHLPAELERRRASRAFVLCGRTVARSTPLIARIRELLGARCAGVFDGIEKDTPRSSVVRAAEAARAAAADLLVAVGAGSVIQGARIVAILLAEKRPIEELVTRYPEEGPAVSPKLLEPKLPIVNVLTAPTTAQNRAGSRMKDDETGRGLEFFDPKTRPVAVFWDEEALRTAPQRLVRNAAASIYWRSVMNLGATSMNPLVEGDRLQAHRLASGALPRIASSDPAPRFELCAAALLQNREADDGGTMFVPHWPARVAYALSTALFSVYPQLAQGEAIAAVAGAALRRLGGREPAAMGAIARALGLREEGAAHETAARIAERLEEALRALAMPARLSGLGLERARLPRVIEHALRNFNADPQREFLRERGVLEEVLETAW
jgi:alcohol dehydrogenase class IV